MSEHVIRGQGWDVVQARLEEVLRGLGRKGFVTLDPPAPGDAPEPRRKLLGRLRGREAPRARPLVQFSHDGRTLDAECSGPASGRSETAFAWTPAQERRLVELGWRTPDELDDWQMYRWRGPDDGVDRIAGDVSALAGEAAALAVATLRDVYGMASPEGLTFVVDEFPP